MLCKIADLIAEVPEAGGMAPRCREYLYNGNENPDIVIDEDRYRRVHYAEDAGPELIAYMESSVQFYSRLLKYNGFYLHSSAVELEGRAYLFSGPSGMGKSTHTRLWQQLFGDAAQVFNEDKPALRCRGGRWFAYGTPWCGKDGINQNKKVPLAAICFLKQAGENRIRRLPPREALTKIMGQTIRRMRCVENLDLLLAHLEKLVQQIPVFELENRPEPEAARLSYETMRRGAEEMGL